MTAAKSMTLCCQAATLVAVIGSGEAGGMPQERSQLDRRAVQRVEVEGPYEIHIGRPSV